MERLSRSWSIFKKSFQLIQTEKKLLIFPIISGISMLILVGLIFSGLVLYFINSGELESSAAALGESTATPAATSPVEWVIYALIYLLTMTLTNFCNVAFFSEIIKGLNSESVSVSRGFKFALSRFKAIFLWSLLAATIGVMLRMLEERMGILGKIVINLIGVAWAVASVFVIPSLAADAALDNPIEALKRSAGTIRRTWGESLAGFVGFGALNLLVSVIGVILFIALLIAMISTTGTPLFYVSLAVLSILVLALFAYFYVAAIARQVYIAALYLYANGQQQIGTFSNVEFEGAFRLKK